MSKGIDIRDYKILMIDDDVEYTTLQQLFLEAKGFEANVINNPIEALGYLKINHVDVILLDFFMPEMTGEDFLKELENIDNDSIIILQTGYSGEKSQDDMLYQLNIQGYYNKAKPQEDLMLMVLSAIKSAKLIREIKYREKEKQIKKIKDKFFADKINTVAGEISEKLMSIGGPAMVLEDWVNKNVTEDEQKEFVEKRLGYLKDAASQIRDAVKALNIASETEMTPKNMLGKINSLLKLEMQEKKSKLEIEASDDFILIDIEEGNVPYLICKDIQNRLGTGSKNVKITANREEDGVLIKITAETSMQESEKQELQKVADFCSSIRMSIGDQITEIVIEKVKK